MTENKKAGCDGNDTSCDMRLFSLLIVILLSLFRSGGQAWNQVAAIIVIIVV